jgi:DNA-binding transcriptional ArsR family regulator
MDGDVDIAAVATLLAEPTRTNMLLALSDGRAFTAGELARQAHVAPSTASEHLTRLVDSGLIVAEKQGRHRFYRLDDPTIIEIIENMSLLAPRMKVRSLGDSERAKAVGKARLCYKHLAGQLGVALSETLVAQQFLSESEAGYILEERGRAEFAAFGLCLPLLTRTAITVIPRHIDWSERRHHLAGELGRALAERLFELGWLRHAAQSRAVYLTQEGNEGLAQRFGLVYS